MDAVLPQSFHLVSLETIDSTSSEARRRAQSGAADSTVVWALEQSAGRGRMGRSWVSEPGNLYASIVLRPSCGPERATEFAFVAANALAEAIATVLPGADVTCKWPNDLLVGGRKVAGILLEAETGPSGSLDFLVVGIGINVGHHPDDDAVRFPATDINAEGATEMTIGELLESVCFQFHRQRKLWEHAGFRLIREAWLERAYGLGGMIALRLPERTVGGTFQGIDEQGALLLKTDGGVERILAGDVLPVA